MKIIAIIKRDLQANTRNRIKFLSLVVAVLLPLAYGFLYLWAFWNPYENMNNVPVAVVNEDAGILYNDRQENYGRQIIDELENNDTLDWKLTNRRDAEDGLDNQKYYAVILIPQNFSADLVSAEEDEPRQAAIKWQTRDSTNFIFTTYFKNVIAALEKNINEKILPEFSQAAQVKLDEATGKLDEATDGANKLSEGLGQLKDGSETLQNNLQKASEGGKQLTDGLGELAAKSSDLNNGIEKAKEGSLVLNTGLESADSGMASLDKGLGKISDGAEELKEGSEKMEVGTRKLAEGNRELNNKVESADNSLSPYYPMLNALSNWINNFNEKYSTQIPNYVSYGKEQKDELIDGTEQLADGSETVADKMADLDEGVGTLQNGISSAKSGAGNLQNGISQLADGSSALNQGLNEIYDGSQKYTAGVSSAYFGSKELSSGLQQLADGSGTLTDGIQNAQNGASTLSAGISSGADQIKQKLTPEKISMLISIINEPVNFQNESINTNETYGAGFAPYFIPLALWMGALILTLLVPTRDLKLNINGVSKLEITIGKFFLLAIVGILQAATLAFSLIYGLGLNVQYPAELVLFCILISLTFISIMQLFSFMFGKIGELLGIIFLMIQLTSASGTFPVQASPRFFQICSLFTPMAYAVRGIRLFILGGNMQIAAKQVFILAAFLFFFLAAKTVATKPTVKATDIYPLIEL